MHLLPFTSYHMVAHPNNQIIETISNVPSNSPYSAVVGFIYQRLFFPNISPQGPAQGIKNRRGANLFSASRVSKKARTNCQLLAWRLVNQVGK